MVTLCWGIASTTTSLILSENGRGEDGAKGKVAGRGLDGVVVEEAFEAEEGLLEEVEGEDGGGDGDEDSNGSGAGDRGCLAVR